MVKLPVATWIGNAAAVLSGVFGATARQARRVGCSRQTVYHHAHQVQAALQECSVGGPPREHLHECNRLLEDELRQLYDYADSLIEVPPARQQQFAATASAMGLSTTQITTLLAIILTSAHTPSRSTVDRRLQAAQKKRASSFRFWIGRAGRW